MSGARPYSTLRSGGRIYWDDAFAGSSYALEDMAFGLARAPRFSGQMTGAKSYSVAQHSVLCAELLRSHGPLVKLLCYFHDIEEFMLGDLGTPIKRCLPDYKAFAVSFREWIFMSERLPALSQYPQVKWADEMAMLLEGQSMMPNEWTWQRRFQFGGIREVWSAKRAAQEWTIAVLQARMELEDSGQTLG